MVVEVMTRSSEDGLSNGGVQNAPRRRQQEMRGPWAGDLPQAIDGRNPAGTLDPDEFHTQLSLGVALQKARQHSQALAPLERAQQCRPADPRPFLHASLSLLALGKADCARKAANEACDRAPTLPQAHSAVGQALLALNEPEGAEKAFAAALRYAPQSPDLWVLRGAARYRQGAIEGAQAAMREALILAPDHGAAKDNLLFLQRASDGERRAASAAPAAGATPLALCFGEHFNPTGDPVRSDNALSAWDLCLSVWKPDNPSACLGLAVEFLSKMPAFAKLPFGEWTQVLFYQVSRGHFLFVIDQHRRVRGFLGWALADRALAEQWVEGRAGLRNDQCREGACVIINAFAAETPDTKIFLVNTMRGMFAAKSTLYFKRHYPDGRARPARLRVNAFVAGKIGT